MDQMITPLTYTFSLNFITFQPTTMSLWTTNMSYAQQEITHCNITTLI